MTTKQKRSYKFAEFKAEALKDVEPTEPFVIADVDPPIEITAPTELERAVNLAELVGPDGEFEMKDIRGILVVICGDAFPRVWELVRKEHTAVMMGLTGALLEHFKTDINGEAASAPGGSKAS